MSVCRRRPLLSVDRCQGSGLASNARYRRLAGSHFLNSSPRIEAACPLGPSLRGSSIVSDAYRQSLHDTQRSGLPFARQSLSVHGHTKSAVPMSPRRSGSAPWAPSRYNTRTLSYHAGHLRVPVVMMISLLLIRCASRYHAGKSDLDVACEDPIPLVLVAFPCDYRDSVT